MERVFHSDKVYSLGNLLYDNTHTLIWQVKNRILLSIDNMFYNKKHYINRYTEWISLITILI